MCMSCCMEKKYQVFFVSCPSVSSVRCCCLMQWLFIFILEEFDSGILKINDWDNYLLKVYLYKKRMLPSGLRANTSVLHGERI